MNPRLGVLRWGAGAALTLGVLLPGGPAPASAASAPDAPGVVLTAAPEASGAQLAGSAAGAGRVRPGRPGLDEAVPVAVAPAAPVVERAPRPPARPPAQPPEDPPEVAPPSSPPLAAGWGADRDGRAAELAAHLVPLGAGLTLMGLGLGYFGLRLRR
ncbi:hypothetical protein [Streptomyces sp. NPDC097619]|uniref:hypothetical protein n=1 Tax=Streptomyces sp. NPDC097619 TaxID=3157228 RepID=UPI003321B4A5